MFSQKIDAFLTSYQWSHQPLRKVTLSSFTTFKCTATADYLIKVTCEQELKIILLFCYKNTIPYLIIGKGSNLIFTDKGFCGILIQLIGDFKKVQQLENQVIQVGAGYMTTALAQYLKNKNLGGGEFLIGIPGTVGGLVFMNAGANDFDCGKIVLKVISIDSNGKKVKRNQSELDLSYRSSVFLKKYSQFPEVIIQAELQFYVDKGHLVAEKIATIVNNRKEKQPIHQSTWGSVFKNPEGNFAAKLIENCGFKGKIFGNLRVSPKHSNFFENQGGATYQDIDQALSQIQKTVWQKKGIFLIPEVRIINQLGKPITKFYNKKEALKI